MDGVESKVIGLTLPAGGRPLRILCIGAHCDDIEIGCGGTLLQWQAEGEVEIDWAILTGDASRRAEAAAAMKEFVKPAARGELLFGEFPDARLPAYYGEIKDFFDELRRKFKPDIIFSHERSDAHQDHRIANELTWGAFRNHLILEYEIPKWDGNYAEPNTYVPLSKEVMDRKIDGLMSVYGSQRSKDWFTPDTFLAISRIRGIESRSPSGHAEGFIARKVVILPFAAEGFA